MRPIFCGNFDYDARQSDLERLFRKYGKVDRVDMKSGFAFIYMDDERDAEDAIRALDRIEFGRKGRRLRVEWTKQERGGGGGGGGGRRPGSSRRSSTNSRPSKTLFVINFDPYLTRTRDLERHFDPYGKILNVRIRRNFAFIQYESQEDASRALDATNMSKLMDRVISVEYAIKDDDDRRNGYSPDRSRDRSPGRRGHDRGRSLSPYRRERSSPDYGRGRSPSPYRRERGSPDYGRGSSPGPYWKERTNSDHGHGSSPGSHRKERTNSDYGRGHSRSPRRERPVPDHGSDPSPKERVSPDYGRGSPSPRRERGSPDDYHRGDPSPQRERASLDDYRRGSPSPQRERISPDDYRRDSPSPQRERNGSDDYPHGPSPDSKLEPRDSPNDRAVSPMNERYRSRTPPARERSQS